MQIRSKSSEETMAFAKEVLNAHSDCKLWLLTGDLAAGKTTFVKGLAQAFGQAAEGIKSPTFAFMNDHKDFIHYDLYRLEQADSLLEEQIEEDLNAGHLVLIEWPERLKTKFHLKTLHLVFKHLGSEKRSILVTQS